MCLIEERGTLWFSEKIQKTQNQILSHQKKKLYKCVFLNWWDKKKSNCIVILIPSSIWNLHSIWLKWGTVFSKEIKKTRLNFD